MFSVFKIFFIAGLLFCRCVYAAEIGSEEKISLTPLQIVQLARKMINEYRIDTAKILLTRYQFPKSEVETERRYLLAVLALREKRLDDAIAIYRELLNENPRLAKIRIQLALAYMEQKSWYRADYHLRLAASEKLPDGIDEKVEYLRFLVRINKNWNVWFSFGIAPDNNVNNSQTGTQCIQTAFGILCNTLEDPEKSVGINVGAGGHYEFRFDDRWRLKVSSALFSSNYDSSEYDDFLYSLSAGPKYVWEKGEVWLAAKGVKRYYGHKDYNSSLGAIIQTDYDLSRRLMLSLNGEYSAVHYDHYGSILDGSIASLSAQTVFSLNAASYFVLRGGAEREKTKNPMYSNRKFLAGIGFGAELPMGFSVYAEPSVQWVSYDRPAWFVRDLSFEEIKEKDKTFRYALRLSNKKFSMFGVVPAVTFAYTDKRSNVWQKEYKKMTLELTFIQNF